MTDSGPIHLSFLSPRDHILPLTHRPLSSLRFLSPLPFTLLRQPGVSGFLAGGHESPTPGPDRFVSVRTFSAGFSEEGQVMNFNSASAERGALQVGVRKVQTQKLEKQNTRRPRDAPTRIPPPSPLGGVQVKRVGDMGIKHRPTWSHCFISGRELQWSQPHFLFPLRKEESKFLSRVLRPDWSWENGPRVGPSVAILFVRGVYLQDFSEERGFESSLYSGQTVGFPTVHPSPAPPGAGRSVLSCLHTGLTAGSRRNASRIKHLSFIW